MTLVAFTVPHGDHAGSSWPRVVSCAFAGCVMRHVIDRAHPAGREWRCADHDDRAQNAIVDYGQMLADMAHRELTQPAELEPWTPSPYMQKRLAERAAQQED